MARIKKYASNQTTNLQPQLAQYGTFITDGLPSSVYFRISEFKDTFTGGKNGFLIEGSEHLLESTEIKIEIIDVNGNPIYYEPGDGVPEYYEGLSKLVAVHIYEDTPIGIAKITVLGELKTYLDSNGNTVDIPTEWKGSYNVKWEKEFKVNRLIANEDRVRFYKRPQVSITELIKPLYSNVVAQKTNIGTVRGIPLAPLENQLLSEYSLPTSYLLTITDNGSYNAWSSSIVGNTISVPSLGYITTAQEIINKTQLVVTNPYTDSNGLVQSFVSSPYTTTFNYLEGVNDLATALTGSFAKINLTDLTSFVGDVARVKVFRKSQSDLSDFQFIQEIQLEANELLLDLDTTTKNQENYGIFTSDIIKNYWVTSSNSLNATFNQSYLYDSVKLNSNSSVYKFHTSKSISITEGVEYTLDFKVRSETSTGNGYIKAFLSGSNDGPNGKVQIEQQIVNVPVQTAVLQKSTVTQNIIAEQMATASLYFEVSGNDWYVADVSLKASQESSFSPDEITFIQSVPRTLPQETFIYRFEFYDINNNYIPVLVEETKTFNGGNLQTIRKSLQLKPSSLYFQFNSGSQPVPPTEINIDIIKTLLTGSVNFTSKSYDDFSNQLTQAQYTPGKFPGLLTGLNTDSPILTVGNFTGSRDDIVVQYIEITGEVEGFTDTIVITRVQDGFGGVNHIIRPYRGTEIRNSSTASLEVQAIRIDGVNDIELSSTSKPERGWPNIQLHVLSASFNQLTNLDEEKFVNLMYATQSGYIKGLTPGTLGSGQINYNAIFDRRAINKSLNLYLLNNGTANAFPAYIASASILATLTLQDLQDGLDAGFMAYNTDTFTINPRTQTIFTPVSASVTGSFYRRGTNAEPFTASFEVFPSMSLNLDYEPEYWMYYVTGKFHPNISVVAIDEKKRTIPSQQASNTTVRSAVSQSKTLTVTLTYTEDYTSSSISLDKTFTIVPEGKPGDESIVFEVVPATVTLNSNSEGIVLDYKPSTTEIKLKQGSRYLVFTASKAAGTFDVAYDRIVSSSITGGKVEFFQTSSMFVTQSSGLVQLSGSISYPLIIHPYYTSSIYTQSIVQNYTKAVDGAPPIDVIITPANITLNADEVGYVSTYASAQSTIQLREGSKFLTFNSNSAQTPGTFKFGNNPTQNITISTLQGNTTNAATASFSLFNYPHISASVNYNIIAYPYSLGPGHRFTSSVFNRTQNITKNVAPTAARTVNLTSTAYTVTYDSDGQVINPTDGITLLATAFNTTGSKYYQFFKDDVAQTGIQTTATKNVAPEDAVASGEVATWKVTLRDGSNSASVPIRAQASVTIAGVGNGVKAYNAVINPENTSIVYKVSGELEIANTSATITATKGGEALTHRPSGFSTQTQDPFGNNIGSLGEYQVSIHSVSGHIVLGDSKVSGSVLNGSTNATISNLAGWVNPEGNPTGQIVYRINFENGKQITFKTQSIAIQFEGATGPGIVMRGVWNNSTDYIGSVETTNYRRDAVIWPDPGNSGGNTRYYAAISGSGPGTATGYHAPDTTPADSAWWQYLGEQDFFVAAKIAIFDESFIKNTLNVGNNAGSAFANIVLAGGRDDPYMAIGQNDGAGNALTVGANTIQTGAGIIGYDKIGIFAGMYKNGATYEPRFSLKGSGGNYLKWNGSGLELSGAITVTAGGNAATETYASQSAATALTSALGIVNSLANGAYSVPGNTFITNTTISAPVIAGIAGYIDKLFRVGDNSSAGIFLDARTTSDVPPGGGAPPADNYRRIWIGTGTYGIYGDPNTSFYVDSDGKFSLKDKLTLSAAGNLSLTGDITANSGTFNGTINASGGNFTGYVTAGTARFGAGVQTSKNGIWINADNYWYDSGTEYKVGNADNYMLWDGSNITFQRGGGSSSNNPAVWVDGDGIASSYAALYVTDGGLKVFNTYGANGGYAIDCVGIMNANRVRVYDAVAANGYITATGNITAFFSDERLKTKLGNIDNAINKISQLNGFYYTTNELANSFGYTDTKTQLGLSAQEVQSVFPDIVSLAPFDMKDDNIDESKSGENYLTIDYSKLVPVLVEAIKELKAEIEELKRNK